MLQMVLVGSSAIYPIWALIMVALSLVLVPRKDYRYLLPHGFLGAVITGFVLILQINFIKGWVTVDAFPFSFLGASVFIIAAWGAVKIIFLWALPEGLDRWTHYLYIALYAMAGMIIEYVFQNLGLRPHASWYSGWMWFFPLYLLFWIDYRNNMDKRKLNTLSLCIL